MKFILTISVLLMLIPCYLTAQVEYDTVSQEVLNNYILDAELERDTVECYSLGAATVRPEFPGGRCALIRYVNENIDFPKSLVDSLRPIEIYCRTIIDRSGKVKIEALSNSQSILLSDRIRTLLGTLPLFQPGEIRCGKKDFQVFLTFYFTKDTAALNSNNPYFIPVFPTNTPYYRKVIKKMCK